MPDDGGGFESRKPIKFSKIDIQLLSLTDPAYVGMEPFEVVVGNRSQRNDGVYVEDGLWEDVPNGVRIRNKYAQCYEGRNPNMRLRGGAYSLGSTGND